MAQRQRPSDSGYANSSRCGSRNLLAQVECAGVRVHPHPSLHVRSLHCNLHCVGPAEILLRYQNPSSSTLPEECYPERVIQLAHSTRGFLSFVIKAQIRWQDMCVSGAVPELQLGISRVSGYGVAREVAMQRMARLACLARHVASRICPRWQMTCSQPVAHQSGFQKTRPL